MHELPVAVVGLDEAVPAVEPDGPAAAGDVDAAPVEFPLVTAAQRAGECDRLGRQWERGGPVSVPVLASEPVEDVIAARGSQRRMDAGRGLSRDLLRTAMGVAVRGLDLPHWVVAHNVAGLPPGVYRWPALDTPVRTGVLRDELYRVCLDQALARDAAFVAIAAAGLAGLSDPDYRAAHLAAGLAEGRLHLAAYALGASASGMTFIDSEVPALLGEPHDALLFTCVGSPLYQSSPGGPPGAPAQVNMVGRRADRQARRIIPAGHHDRKVAQVREAAMLDLEYRHVDVFSRRALAGNGLVVVLDTAGLPGAVMQEVTREVRQFETAFLADVDLAGRVGPAADLHRG